MRTYQKVYAASASDAVINNLIMWTSPIWLPIVGVMLLWSVAFPKEQYCVDVEAKHQAAVTAMYKYHREGSYQAFEHYKDEARKLDKQLQYGKCKKTPTL